jgi:hypothetical protein
MTRQKLQFRSILFEVLIKPPYSLEIRRLLCKFLLANAEISADSEAMLDAAVEGNLVRKFLVLKRIFDFPPQLSRENGIRLRGRNTQRSRDCIHFFGGNERGVSNESRVEAFSGSEESEDVLSAEAIAYAADFGDSVLGTEGFDGGGEDLVDDVCWVGFEPVH